MSASSAKPFSATTRKASGFLHTIKRHSRSYTVLLKQSLCCFIGAALIALNKPSFYCCLLYTSTSKAVNKYRNLDIIPYEGLIEINGGHWENVSWKKIPELYPDEAYCWAMEPHKFAPLNGETMLQVRNRIINTTLTIANMHPGKTIVCVSHGCVDVYKRQ